MYRINAARTVNKTVWLTGRGFPVRLKVRVSVDQLIKDLERAQKNLSSASALLKTNWSEEAFHNFCAIAHDMFALVLGRENTDKALAYFKGEYVEMLAAFTPFIENVIAPAVGAVFADLKGSRK